MVNSHAVDVGCFLARQLFHVVKQDSGDIIIGGMITLIAVECGMELEDRSEGVDRDILDLWACLNMKMIAKCKSGYWLRLQDMVQFHLLNPILTTLFHNKNWRIVNLPLDTDDEEKLVPPPPAGHLLYDSTTPCNLASFYL